MNTLIQEIAQQGRAQELYGLVNNIALVIALIYSFWHGKKLGVPLWKMFVLLLVLYFGMNYLLGGIWELLLYISRQEMWGINKVVNSIVRAFLFVPLIVFPVAKLLKLKGRLAWDAVVMYPLLRSALAQIACIFTGCCAGYAWGWGLYNPNTCAYHFPVQLIETVLTLGIFVRLLFYLRKNGNKSDGTLFPRMLFWYGIMRFICEALRDNQKLLPLCSGVGIHAILLVIAAIFWFLAERILKTKNNKL